jgi:hypothetical protein
MALLALCIIATAFVAGGPVVGMLAIIALLIFGAMTNG